MFFNARDAKGATEKQQEKTFASLVPLASFALSLFLPAALQR
jgi:hypothetical protein